MTYTLDASALIALIKKERGHQKVQLAFQSQKPFIHQINWIEVNYKLERISNLKWEKVKQAIQELPLSIAEIFNSDIAQYSQYLKTHYHLSLADSIGLAFARMSETTFLTANRQDLEIIKTEEPVKIEFIR